MKKILYFLQQLSQKLLQPMFLLGALGIFMTIIATIGTMFSFMDAIVLVSQSVLSQISVFFVMGIAAYYVEKEKMQVAMIALFVYLIFLGTHHLFLGEVFLSQHILGIEVSQMGIFPASLLGMTTGKIIEKTKDKDFGPYLGIFSGLSYSLAWSLVFASLFGFVTARIWPSIQQVVLAVSQMFLKQGAGSAFLYGFVNKLLLPFGLHHLLWIPVQWSSFGGVANISGITYHGAYSIWLAQLPYASEITKFHPSLQYLRDFSYTVLPLGAALAIYRQSLPENKTRMKKELIPAFLSASIAGVTEPIEFLFLSKSKKLWLIHALLSGLGFFLASVFQLQLEVSTLPPLIMNMVVVPYRIGHHLRIVPIFVILAFLEYTLFTWIIQKDDLKLKGSQVNIDKHQDVRLLLKALGGQDNISKIGNCYTRLRIDLLDVNEVDLGLLETYQQKGVILKENHIQIVIGTQVESVRLKLESFFK